MIEKLVHGYSQHKWKGGYYWKNLYRCPLCGESFTARSGDIISGKQTSCGCKKKKHGYFGTPIYRVWAGMISRCHGKKVNRDYQGRGITVCREWREDFLNFLKDMGECPEGLSLERKDNSKGYSKRNCVWANTETQSRNKRNNKFIELYGVKLCLADWSKVLEIPKGRIGQRLRYGWSEVEAVLGKGAVC